MFRKNGIFPLVVLSSLCLSGCFNGEGKWSMSSTSTDQNENGQSGGSSGSSDGGNSAGGSNSAATGFRLIFSTQPTTIIRQNATFNVQPTVAVADENGTVISTSGRSVALSAFQDATCSTAAPGNLSTWPVSTLSGYATFPNLTYDRPGNIYLKASSSGLVSGCSNAIKVFDYKTYVLKDNPVGYWRLGDAVGSTSALDSSTNNLTGTATSLNFGTSGALFSDSSTAANFNGANSYVNVPHSPLFNVAGSFSAELWMKPSNVSYDQGLVVRFNETGGSPAVSQFKLMLNQNKIRFVLSTAAYPEIVTSPMISVSTWYHIVAVADASAGVMRVFVNGSLAASAGFSGVPSSVTMPLAIGVALNAGSPHSGTFFTGILDDVAFYNYALPASVILNHYSAGKDGNFF